jgi:hypothetical protein
MTAPRTAGDPTARSPVSMRPMRPLPLALLVASLLGLFTPAALAQPGCSDATLAELARHRARYFAATRALRAATGIAAAEAAVARWEALGALYWATSQPCERPSPQVAALRRPLLGATDADALAALQRASQGCARVARREHVLGLTLFRCVLGANTPAPRDGWTPTPRPGMAPFFAGTARESSQMFAVARSSLAAMRAVEAQRPLGADERAIVTSQRLALAAMAAAVRDEALVNETLAPLGASPEASELRAELAATLGDGVGAVRTLREAAAASPGSAAVHAALAQAIWFFARPGRPDIDPRLWVWRPTTPTIGGSTGCSRTSRRSRRRCAAPTRGARGAPRRGSPRRRCRWATSDGEGASRRR